MRKSGGPNSTFGSSTVTGDEFRFSRTDGMLVSAYLHVPDENGDWAEWAPRLKRISVQGPGTLIMDDRSHFSIGQTETRLFSPQGEILAGVFESVAPDALDGRLLVAEGFELLRAEGRYCGWLLHNPLVLAGEEDGLSNSSANDAFFVAEFFRLINEESIDQLYSRDPGLKALLQQLLARIYAEQADLRGARETLARYIEKLLRRWFA